MASVFVWLGNHVPNISYIPNGWQTVCVGYHASCMKPEMDANKNALLDMLRKRAKGPGKAYVTKLMLPWILSNAKFAIALDYDLWIKEFNALEHLAAEFEEFSQTEMIGLVDDTAKNFLYPSFPVKPNGGVQLLDLNKMRTGIYEHAIKHDINNIGYLGDQTAYAQLSVSHTSMFHRLSCKYNRQLSRHFDLRYTDIICPEGCSIVHGNQPQFKQAIREANQGNISCIFSMLRNNIAYKDCFY